MSEMPTILFLALFQFGLQTCPQRILTQIRSFKYSVVAGGSLYTTLCRYTHKKIVGLT